MPSPSRGEIWSVDLEPIRGHEQGGQRPALIVSVDPFNHGPAGLSLVLPITSVEKHIPFHVRVEPGESGLRVVSFIKCEALRSISTERFHERLGQVNRGVMVAVEDRLRILLGL